MEALAKILLERGARWWLANRPFSKEKRAYRKLRRQIRRKNRARAKLGQPLLEEPTKPEVVSMFALFNSFRTSTVSTISGLITYIVLNFVPADVLTVIEQFFTDAANADGGAVQFVVAAVVAYIFARLNKTPEDVGVL